MSHSMKIGFNYTTILNLFALALILWIYWMYRTRDKSSPDQLFAQDLICGMQVRIADAPASYVHEGKSYYFCMPGCRDSFAANPDKYVSN